MADNDNTASTPIESDQPEFNGDPSKTVQSIDRVLSIIEALADHGAPMHLGDLAEQVDLKPSTVHRLLNTLLVRGFVEQDEDSRYKLSMKLYYIGNRATYAADIKTMAAPFMRELLEKVNETVNLAILDRGEVVYIDQLESNNIVVVKMFARVGNRGPAHCTGSGKVLLAHLPPDELTRYLAETRLERFTRDTITDPEMLGKELARVAREGYALDLGERDEEVRCVATPIMNHEGQAVAALSVSGPSMRMTPSYISNELIQMAKDVSLRLSKKIGYQGD
ncbi:MAG: IclR family transcriptional regulator [Syntrophomonadaceae bacterium]|nr:IclR family transcriptional regulator [Syntrophomonadaceae bacterium]